MSKPRLLPASSANHLHLCRLHRYDYQLSPSHYRYVRDGNLPRSSDLATAADSVLTALAQLGACQTGTSRAFISLFDSTHQYIVAEATQSIRIAADLPNDAFQDTLSLCGTAIPRSQGTCDHVLSLVPNLDRIAEGAELPLSFVPNLVKDDRFRSRSYCQFPGDGQFYAGVPIRTRKGINIGAYCVMNASIPSGWDENYSQRLRDISRAIMNHLEFRRSSYENQRHERFTRGLSAFIEGKNIIPEQRSPARNLYPGLDKANMSQDQTILVQSRTPRDIQEPDDYGFPGDQKPPLLGKSVLESDPLATPTTPSNLTPMANLDGTSPASNIPTASIQSTQVDLTEPHVVFSKAASIIQGTFDVEGCVFLDVAMGSHRQSDRADGATSTNDANQTAEGLSFTSSSDEHCSTLPGEPVDSACDILGVAVTRNTNHSRRLPAGSTPGTIPKRFLAKLLKRYPDGKIFNFDAVGELQSSESSEDDGAPHDPAALNVPAAPLGEEDKTTPSASDEKQERKPFRRRKEGCLLQKAFPGARSVMFVPVWDPKRERWLSGGFIYSLAAARFFSDQDELSLLLAFSKVIGAELLNIETLRTEKAKSDALGSLSHELRSPLHGVILSTEMLNDTELTVYQSNATHTIETCCRTLLDTIDHLLDFSKVNSFSLSSTKGFRSLARPEKLRKGSSQFGKKGLYKHLRLDGLVEDVVVSVFAGFNFERMSPDQFGPPSNSRSTVAKDSPGPDTKLSEDWLGAFERQSIGDDRTTNVSVYVTADPACNWLLYLQAGALRRIIMNLFGNSLKHTTSGTIQVTLSQENSKRSATQKVIKLTVADTGKGISEDFLQHSLFQPFSQEDEMSSGIGLGLSLVKKMVSQLRGRIKVQSRVGAGTTVQVTLPQETVMQNSGVSTQTMSEEDELFESQVRELTGLGIGIDGFGADWGPEGSQLVETICRRWLNLRLVTSEEAAPDVILRSEDTLTEEYSQASSVARTPMIVVCRDAPSAWRHYKAHETVGSRRIVEFVSQP